MQIRDQGVGDLVFVHLAGSAEGGGLKPDMYAVQAAMTQFLDNEEYIGLGHALSAFDEYRVALRGVDTAPDIVN
ncbi:hypothetical protein [Streptomyces erythrochromogenes]|uniref:hypothetical protein n=1 Tax=Streptomyces erythrochromogenes TaxID=285574 RepID=UPI0033D8BA91